MLLLALVYTRNTIKTLTNTYIINTVNLYINSNIAGLFSPIYLLPTKGGIPNDKTYVIFPMEMHKFPMFLIIFFEK